MRGRSRVSEPSRAPCWPAGLQGGRFLDQGLYHPPPAVKQQMFSAQQPPAEFCAPDNKFPHTYTESSVSASGCLASWNSCLLITWKGHQKKKKETKARVPRNFPSVPRTLQQSS